MLREQSLFRGSNVHLCMLRGNSSFTFAGYESDRLLLNISRPDEPSVSWMLIRPASFLSSPVYNSVLLAVSPPTAAFSSHLFLYLYTAEHRLLPDASSVSCRQPRPVLSVTPPSWKPVPPHQPTAHCPDKSVLSSDAAKSPAAVFVCAPHPQVEFR